MGVRKGEGQKGETKRENARERVICLQSIGCTSDHSWDPTIISFHLSAYFNFFSLFSIPFLLFFSHSIPIQLRLGVLAGHWLIAQGPSIQSGRP